jgi:hypothetical protein
MEMAYYWNRPTLADAIDKAAMALKPNGKRHSHQRRLSKAVLRKVCARLMARKRALRRATDFAGLLAMIEKCRVKGFGSLAAYDCATRLGAWLCLSPKFVYLHAGTRAGAKAVGLDVSKKHLLPSDLPRAMRVLAPDEMEDFLCIYKRELRMAMS